jgi:hypothetical protein
VNSVKIGNLISWATKETIAVNLVDWILAEPGNFCFFCGAIYDIN